MAFSDNALSSAELLLQLYPVELLYLNAPLLTACLWCVLDVSANQLLAQAHMFGDLGERGENLAICGGKPALGGEGG